MGHVEWTWAWVPSPNFQRKNPIFRLTTTTSFMFESFESDFFRQKKLNLSTSERQTKFFE